MKVQVEMINGKSYMFDYEQSLTQLEEHIEFCENNSFFLTSDGTRCLIKQMVTFKVMDK